MTVPSNQGGCFIGRLESQGGRPCPRNPSFHGAETSLRRPRGVPLAPCPRGRLPERRQADLRQGRRREERGLFPPLKSYSATPPLRSHQVTTKEWGGQGPLSSDPAEWECCVWRGVQGRLSLQQRGWGTSGLGPPGSRITVIPRNGLCGAGTPGYLKSPDLRAAVQSSDLEAARRGRTGEA